MDEDVTTTKDSNEKDKDKTDPNGKQKIEEKPRLVIVRNENSDSENENVNLGFEKDEDCREEPNKNRNEDEVEIREHVNLVVNKTNENGNPNNDNGRPENENDNVSLLTEEEEKKLKKRIRFIFIILNIMGFLGSFSYWMQSGVLPYLTRKLGVYSSTFGYMQSTYAFYQMIGSPIFGRCGDVFGCRCVMIISELSSMVTYGSLAFATNVFMLFMSRVPALAMHNLQGSYMIITDITLPEERAKMLGILGVSHGLGMIVGSFVGGVVTEAVGEETTPLVAASGNLIAVLLVALFIPADTKLIRRQLSNIKDNTEPESNTMSSLTGFKEIIKVLNLPNIKYLLFVKITSAFPFTLVYSFFSMAIMDYFHLGPKVNGIVLSYIGTMVILVQGILVGLLTKYFMDSTIIKLSISLNTGAFLFLIVAENVYLLCVVFLPLVIGGTVSHIVITAAVTKIVPIEDTGSALGLTLALHALIRSVAPSVGGLIFNYIGWPFFGVVGYTLSLFILSFIVLVGKDEF